MNSLPRPGRVVRRRLSIVLVGALVGAVLASAGDAANADDDSPRARERMAFDTAVANQERLDLPAERRWRWLLWSMREAAWDGQRLRVEPEVAPLLVPFAAESTLQRLADGAGAVARDASSGPLQRRLKRADSGYELWDDGLAVPPATPRTSPSGSDAPMYEPFDSRAMSHASGGVCGDPYSPFGDDASVGDASRADTEAAPCPTWSQLDGTACRVSTEEAWDANTGVRLGGSTLLHPTDRTLRDLELRVGDATRTLAAGAPIVAVEVSLGRLGRALEMTAVGPALDPFGPVEGFERVYLLADGDPEALRRRAATVHDALCIEGAQCAAYAFPFAGAALDLALVHVRPGSEGFLFPAGWAYQLTDSGAP